MFCIISFIFIFTIFLFLLIVVKTFIFVRERIPLTSQPFFRLEKIYIQYSSSTSMKKRLNKSGQAWVETVIYTLIGLSIIGIVLGVATPKIKELTDKAIIDQTISAMNDLDNKIVAVQVAAGNSR